MCVGVFFSDKGTTAVVAMFKESFCNSVGLLIHHQIPRSSSISANVMVLDSLCYAFFIRYFPVH